MVEGLRRTQEVTPSVRIRTALLSSSAVPFLALALGLLAATGVLAGQGAKAPPNDDCLACHSDPEARRENGSKVSVPPAFGVGV